MLRLFHQVVDAIFIYSVRSKIVETGDERAFILQHKYIFFNIISFFVNAYNSEVNTDQSDQTLNISISDQNSVNY